MIEQDGTCPVGSEYLEELVGEVGPGTLVVGQNTHLVAPDTVCDTTTTTQLSVHEYLDRLLQKYESDPYILALLEEHMKTKLPGKLENAKSKQQTHLAKQLEVDKMCAEFVYKFLHQTNAGRFFYVPATKRYIEYLDNRYYHCHVDDITVCVSDYIRSCDNDQWHEYRSMLVGAVFANIRTTPLYTTIPTSTTIQSVYQKLVSTHIFLTKSDAKLFLTAVGDNVLGKTDDKELVYYYPENAHEFISVISLSAIQWFGVKGIDKRRGVFSSFRNSKAPTNVTPMLLNCYPEQEVIWTNCDRLKLLALAVHYSDRYTNASTFLSKHCTDNQTIQYARTLCGENAIHKVVERFYHEYEKQIVCHVIDSPTESTQGAKIGARQISDVHVLFMWRRFLRTNRIPQYVFDTCPLTSNTDLPINWFTAQPNQTLFSEQFTSFWDSSMVAVSPTEKNQCVDLSELSLLFRNWLGGEGDSVQWDDDQMMDAIRYFYPGVVVDGKNVCAYSKHWNKLDTVTTFINDYLALTPGAHSPANNRSTPLFAYRSYCEHSRAFTNLIVSKPYFDSVWSSIVFTLNNTDFR